MKFTKRMQFTKFLIFFPFWRKSTILAIFMISHPPAASAAGRGRVGRRRPRPPRRPPRPRTFPPFHPPAAAAAGRARLPICRLPHSYHRRWVISYKECKIAGLETLTSGKT